MTTRTITVTVQNVGGNNKYFLDGVQQDTLTLAEGGTYVFNWSAATTHPLRFSTTSDGTHNSGSEYTTGVTKDDSSYLTTIQVAASAPTLYYYCQYHPNMGGQLNTEAANTWGLLPWDEGSWGSQNNITLDVTGVSTTTSIGAVTIDAEIGEGWGNNTWGLLNWGQNIGGAEVAPTGLSVTSTVGTVTIDAEIGEGWGRGTWGNRAWDAAYSVAVSGVVGTTSIGAAIGTTSVTVAVTGVATTSAIGSVSTTQGVEITPTGLPLTGSLGTVTFDGDAAVGITGISMTSAVGTPIVAPITLIDVTGVAMTSSVGSNTITITCPLDVTGVSSTSSVGSIVPVSGYDVTGVAATSAVGSPTEVTGTGLVDDVTGVVLTSSTGSVIIIAWNEIDTGTPVTWTEITTAA